MRTFEEVFEAFGGPAALSKETGIPTYHTQTMKTRGSIPPGYWSEVVDAAARLGIEGVTLETLAAIAAAKAGREPPLAPADQGEDAKAAS